MIYYCGISKRHKEATVTALQGAFNAWWHMRHGATRLLIRHALAVLETCLSGTLLALLIYNSVLLDVHVYQTQVTKCLYACQQHGRSHESMYAWLFAQSHLMLR